MITSLAWIPKGVPRSRPIQYEVSPEELERLKEIAREVDTEHSKKQNKVEQESIKEGLRVSKGKNENDDDENEMELPAELKMNEYDADENTIVSVPAGAIDDDDDDDDGEDDDSNNNDNGKHNNYNDEDVIRDLDDSMDQLEIAQDGGKTYILETAYDEDDEEDNCIQPSDSVFVCAITEDDFSHLEVQILTNDGNLYVHHDITLPEFPLCLAWCDCPPYLSDGSQLSIGNYMAVGTFDPAIEIWNLDVLDPLEPTAVLGGIEKSNKKTSTVGKKSKKSMTTTGVTATGSKKDRLAEGSHLDAVMGLSWNKSYRQAIASGSADKTVKIWDITTQQCYHTFNHHQDKVQSVQFHPIEAWLLASGGFDKKIALIDCRTGTIGSKYTVSADLESIVWNPFNKDQLFCSLEDGMVSCIDQRRGDRPLYSFQAHDKTTSSISFSHMIPGMLATASIDKTVKVWDVINANEKSAPVLMGYKSMGVGKLFSVQFYQSSPFVLAAGGDKGIVAVWETDETKEIEERFSSRIQVSTDVYAVKSVSADTSASIAKTEAKAAVETVTDSTRVVSSNTSMEVEIEEEGIEEEIIVGSESTASKKKKKKSKDKKKK